MKILIGRNKTEGFIDKEDYVKYCSDKNYLCNTEHGYVIIKKYLGFIDGKSKYQESYLHRLITNAPKGLQVDHINGNRLDNRKINLRICSSSDNSKNRPKNKGNYKGVYLDKLRNKWIAQITKNYKCYHIGSFEKEIEAALAYNEKAKELHGEFAYLNKIQ